MHFPEVVEVLLGREAVGHRIQDLLGRPSGLVSAQPTRPGMGLASEPGKEVIYLWYSSLRSAAWSQHQTVCRP